MAAWLVLSKAGFGFLSPHPVFKLFHDTPDSSTTGVLGVLRVPGTRTIDEQLAVVYRKSPTAPLDDAEYYPVPE